MNDWISLAIKAAGAAKNYCDEVRNAVFQQVARDDRPDPALIEANQRIVHGFAWINTTVAALEAIADWAARAERAGRFAEVDELVLRIALGEHLHHLITSLPMGQSEHVRPIELGTEAPARLLSENRAVSAFLENGNCAATRLLLVKYLSDGARPTDSFDDETLDLIRDQFRAFTAD